MVICHHLLANKLKCEKSYCNRLKTMHDGSNTQLMSNFQIGIKNNLYTKTHYNTYNSTIL